LSSGDTEMIWAFCQSLRYRNCTSPRGNCSVRLSYIPIFPYREYVLALRSADYETMEAENGEEALTARNLLTCRATALPEGARAGGFATADLYHHQGRDLTPPRGNRTQT
jgi:hypothetical protein